MPRMDGTGPRGKGAMLGRGLGTCEGINAEKHGENCGEGKGLGLGFRRGIGCGKGRGQGRGFAIRQRIQNGGDERWPDR